MRVREPASRDQFSPRLPAEILRCGCLDEGSIPAVDTHLPCPLLFLFGSSRQAPNTLSPSTETWINNLTARRTRLPFDCPHGIGCGQQKLMVIHESSDLNWAQQSVTPTGSRSPSDVHRCARITPVLPSLFQGQAVADGLWVWCAVSMLGVTGCQTCLLSPLWSGAGGGQSAHAALFALNSQSNCRE